MQEDADRLFYLGVGPIAAILLGVGLMPFRGLTVASNFAFAFVGLTILAGELGGRGAALATALASALSLDFFLTRPYLHLAIHDKDDVIAFLGLAAVRPARGRARLAPPRAAPGEPPARAAAGRAARGRLGGSRRRGPAAARRRGTRSVPAGGDRRPRRGRKAARAGGERRGRRVRSGSGRESRGARRDGGALGVAGGRPPAGDGRAPAARRGRAPGRLGGPVGRRAARRERRETGPGRAGRGHVDGDRRARSGGGDGGRMPPASPSWSVGGVRRASNDHERDR